MYGIVQQCGGFITVESEPGKGACFSIHLPHVDGVPESRTPEGGRAAPRGGTETLLVVEDDPEVRMLMVRALRSVGYQVEEAEDGEKGLQVAERRAGTLALVITDAVMPRMGGRELARAIEAKFPHLKTLLVSGYARSTVDNSVSQSVGGEFLSKPFRREDFLRKVREMLDARDGA